MSTQNNETTEVNFVVNVVDYINSNDKIASRLAYLTGNSWKDRRFFGLFGSIPRYANLKLLFSGAGIPMPEWIQQGIEKYDSDIPLW